MGDGHKSLINQNSSGAGLWNAAVNGSNNATVIQRNQGQSLDKQMLNRTRENHDRW